MPKKDGTPRREKTENRVASESPGEEQEAKRRLIQAATTLFARKGYDGVTVRDITEAARANLSLVSYYFGGKEGLYRACLQDFSSGRLEKLGALQIHAKTSEEFVRQIHNLVEVFVTGYAERPEVLPILMQEMERGLPIAAPVFESTILPVSHAVMKILSDGQTQGFVRKELDPLIVTVMLMGALIHFFRVAEIGRRYYHREVLEPRELQNIIHTVSQIMTNGLLT